MLNGDKRELAYIVRVSEATDLEGYDRVHYIKSLRHKVIYDIDQLI